MENNISTVLISVGVLVAMSVAVMAVLRWRQQARVSHIKDFVTIYLRVRYGVVPARLNIIYSHDTYWPVIARFVTPGTGIQHRLQFMCRGKESAWFLLSQKDEQDESKRNAPIAAA